MVQVTTNKPNPLTPIIRYPKNTAYPLIICTSSHSESLTAYWLAILYCSPPQLPCSRVEVGAATTQQTLYIARLRHSRSLTDANNVCSCERFACLCGERGWILTQQRARGRHMVLNSDRQRCSVVYTFSGKQSKWTACSM